VIGEKARKAEDRRCMHAAECSTCRSQESVLTSPGSHALESSRREHGAKTKSENIITVKKLAKSFGKVKAVRGVSFEVKKGEIFGLLRPNGAGKTTTLEMMAGLRKSDSGRPRLGGFTYPGSENDRSFSNQLASQGISFLRRSNVHRSSSLPKFGKGAWRDLIVGLLLWLMSMLVRT
jgi:ABC-type glutathione transport system ATPase component